MTLSEDTLDDLRESREELETLAESDLSAAWVVEELLETLDEADREETHE